MLNFSQTLTNYCFYGMFQACTGLTVAPELPATTLTYRCYTYMFYGCRGLTVAPELPATTLATECYKSMFDTCTSLTVAPELPATTLAYYCYQYMFYKCSSLNEITVKFTEWNSTSDTSNWLNSVAAEGTFYAPEALPDTRGVSNIPEGWTKVAI